MVKPEVFEPEVGPVGDDERLPRVEGLDPVIREAGGEAVQGAAQVEAGASVKCEQGAGGSHNWPGWTACNQGL